MSPIELANAGKFKSAPNLGSFLFGPVAACRSWVMRMEFRPKLQNVQSLGPQPANLRVACAQLRVPIEVACAPTGQNRRRTSLLVLPRLRWAWFNPYRRHVGLAEAAKQHVGLAAAGTRDNVPVVDDITYPAAAQPPLLDPDVVLGKMLGKMPSG